MTILDSYIDTSALTPGDFTYRHIMRAIDNHLPDTERLGLVMDIGCGNGKLSRYMASKGNIVVAVDPHAKCEQTSRVVVVKRDFQELDTTSLKPCSFILCTEVLEHIDDDVAALKKMAGLLKPGGILVLTVPLEQAPLHRLRMRLTGHDSFDERVGHLRRYSIHDLCMDMLPPELHICEMYGNEGPLRNWLFTTRSGHWLLRGIRGPIADVVTAIDNVLGKLFGTAQLILVAQKQGIR